MRLKVVLVLFILFFFQACLYSSENGSNSINKQTTPDDVVPFDACMSIALAEAQKTWGAVTPGPVYACLGLDGKVNYYYCPFRINGDFKDYDSIVAGLMRWRQAQESSAVNSTAYYNARRRRWGAGDYGTIVVSARYSLVPVAERIHGLPPYYTGLDYLKQKAMDYLTGPPSLVDIYYLGPFDQIYEFAFGGTTVYLSKADMGPVDLPAMIALSKTQNRLSAEITGINRKKVMSLWIVKGVKPQ